MATKRQSSRGSVRHDYAQMASGRRGKQLTEGKTSVSQPHGGESVSQDGAGQGHNTSLLSSFVQAITPTFMKSTKKRLEDKFSDESDLDYEEPLDLFPAAEQFESDSSSEEADYVNAATNLDEVHKEKSQLLQAIAKEKAKLAQAKEQAELEELRSELAQLRAQNQTAKIDSKPVKSKPLKSVVRVVDPGPDEVRQVVQLDQRRRERRVAGPSPGSLAHPQAGASHLQSPRPSLPRQSSDSEEEINDEALLEGERIKRRSKRSGITQKATDRVRAAQLWPHVALQGQYVTEGISFNDLDFRLFVAGETEIISAANTPQVEKEGRLELLKQLAYLQGAYPWDVLKHAYTAILTKIEMQGLSWGQWDSAFFPIIQWSIATHRDNKASKSSRSKSEKKKTSDTLFCKDYQTNQCGLKAPHAARLNGKSVTVQHICAKCFLYDKSKAGHAENSVECPHKTE